MEVCGGHTHAIYRFGLKDLLPPNIELMHGPGCPVCVLPMGRIDDGLAMAEDPRRDPHRVRRHDARARHAGQPARTQGARLRRPHRLLAARRAAPGAGQSRSARRVLRHRLRDHGAVDGADAQAGEGAGREQLLRLLQSRHDHSGDPRDSRLARHAASTRSSARATSRRSSAAARTSGSRSARASRSSVAGFEPLDLLQSIAMLLRQLRDGRAEVENQYNRVVPWEGNRAALEAMADVFELRPYFEWRGHGIHLAVGAAAERRATPRGTRSGASRCPGVRVTDPKAAQCGEVLKGVLKPPRCKLFGKECTPEHPVGALMVSSEGSCAAYYTYVHRKAVGGGPMGVSSPGVRVIQRGDRAGHVPRSAHRDGARRRRQGQPSPGRRTDRAAADRARAPNRSATRRIVDIGGTRLAVTADSFVVTPLRFPGGSIGELAVNGTVNDLAVAGARPAGLLVTFVLEAGLPVGRARGRGARDGAPPRGAPACAILGGDTKVVEHGKADGMYVTTTGFGELLPGVSLAASQRAARRSRAGVGPDWRSRHHHPAGARRARPRGRPRVRHALGGAAGRRAGRRGRAGRALDARPDPRRRRHRAQRAGPRLRPRHRPRRRPAAGARRGARRLRAARPRSAAHRQRRTVPRHRRAGARRRGAGRAAAAPGGERPPIIGEIRESAGRARCSPKPATAAAASSTCWSATRCRGSARAPARRDP